MYGKNLFILIVFFAGWFSVYAQGSSGSRARYESRYIVDMPTAGIIPKGAYSVNADIFENGGIMTEIEASPFSYFNMGISFGGNNIIGGGNISWQSLPGLLLKIRIFDESKAMPAILLGFDSQGRGAYSAKRFQTMSPGIYASLSKNYSWLLGYIALHGGLNYSLEPLPVNRIPNIYFGIEQTIGKYASLNLEFNTNLDEKNHTIMKERGLFNASFRFSIIPDFTIELLGRDLMSHYVGSNGFIRTIRLEYIGKF